MCICVCVCVTDISGNINMSVHVYMCVLHVSVTNVIVHEYACCHAGGYQRQMEVLLYCSSPNFIR